MYFHVSLMKLDITPGGKNLLADLVELLCSTKGLLCQCIELQIQPCYLQLLRKKGVLVCYMRESHVLV